MRVRRTSLRRGYLSWVLANEVESAKGVGKCVAGTGRSMRGGTEARTWDEATELPFKGGGMVRRPVRGRSGRPLGATLRTLD